MMVPKRISQTSVPGALEKALRYRLLNEPLEAESICRDVLAVEPDNREALITLLLALTDQFDHATMVTLQMAKDVLESLPGEYEREYYTGIIHERWGKAQLARGMPVGIAIDWLRQAMRDYERAEALRRPDDPDAVLRWNACARFLTRVPQADTGTASADRDVTAEYGDDIPTR
jgi:hypothetical protein